MLIGCFVSTLSFGQYEASSWPEFFFGRQPSARAEAMGKSYVANTGDLGSVYFNPAAIASIQKTELNTSYTPPGSYLTKGYYLFYGVGYKINKHIQIALSRFRFDFGKTQVINAVKRPYEEKNTLTISSEPIKNFQCGINLNYFVWQPGIDEAATTFFFDGGVLKKFSIPIKKANHQSINIGASISNFNYAKTQPTFNNINYPYKLPVITRYGACYELNHGRSFLIDSEAVCLVKSKYNRKDN